MENRRIIEGIVKSFKIDGKDEDLKYYEDVFDVYDFVRQRKFLILGYKGTGKTYFLKIFYNLSGETLKQGILFSYPMSFCVLLQLCLFTFGAYFRISNMTKLILIGSTVSSVLNLGLDYLFVLGKFGFPKFGITMVGFTTVFSMFVNLLIYIILDSGFVFKDLQKFYFIISYLNFLFLVLCYIPRCSIIFFSFSALSHRLIKFSKLSITSFLLYLFLRYFFLLGL